MPCNSDYLESDHKEIEMSRVCCLIDELDGQQSINRSHWDGYHPNVYNKHLSQRSQNQLVDKLCKRLQRRDVTKLSLEMQIWWRDHQKADKARLQEEMKQLKDKRLRKAALAKLSPYEQQLLGVK